MSIVSILLSKGSVVILTPPVKSIEDTFDVIKEPLSNMEIAVPAAVMSIVSILLSKGSVVILTLAPVKSIDDTFDVIKEPLSSIEMVVPAADVPS